MLLLDMRGPLDASSLTTFHCVVLLYCIKCFCFSDAYASGRYCRCVEMDMLIFQPVGEHSLLVPRAGVCMWHTMGAECHGAVAGVPPEKPLSSGAEWGCTWALQCSLCHPALRDGLLARCEISAALGNLQKWHRVGRAHACCVLLKPPSRWREGCHKGMCPPKNPVLWVTSPPPHYASVYIEKPHGGSSSLQHLCTCVIMKSLS